MNRVAHRLAGVVSGALVLAAVALPATTARATTHAAPHEIVNSVTCVNPQNPVWGDGTCGP